MPSLYPAVASAMPVAEAAISASPWCSPQPWQGSQTRCAGNLDESLRNFRTCIGFPGTVKRQRWESEQMANVVNELDDRLAKFRLGQVVKHRLFSFRGVIFDVD